MTTLPDVVLELPAGRRVNKGGKGLRFAATFSATLRRSEAPESLSVPGAA